MINKILFQQKEERDYLLKLKYVDRINLLKNADYHSTSLIKLITGPRRAGKSVLALQILRSKNFAYLNFDDDQLLNNFDEDAILQTLTVVYPQYDYLLLDEIQNLPRWELWVNKLYRRGANLVITGSNAKLLSSEMATSLTGRFIQISVFPFSFAEALRFQQIALPDENNVTPQNMGEILSRFKTYLINGGFPEIILTPSILKNYLSSLFDSVLLKDIVKRFKIRQTQQFYDLSNYVLSNYTNPYSYNQLKIHLNFKSVATVQKFISYLEEPYLFVNLSRYATKIKTQKKSPMKSYAIDNGFIQARSFELSPNYGRLLENLIFIELMRRGYQPETSLFYYRTRNNREIDFVCRTGNQVEQLIQVCYDISNPKTLKREIDALSEASQELSCVKLMIITWDKSEVINRNDQPIQLIPAYQWLANF